MVEQEGHPPAEGGAEEMAVDVLAALEATLGYAFKDRALLEAALTAPSFRATYGFGADNQRLEFLGDAVLGLLAAEHLFKTHQDVGEGVLTIRRSHLTSGSALARLARRIGLGACLRIGLSDEMTGGVNKDRLLAEAMEAVFGALWCEAGLSVARVAFEAIVRLEEEVPVADLQENNPKGHLQEIAQRCAWAKLPAYELVSVSGPDHAPAYVVRVRVDGGREATGEGSTKRAAMVSAARRILETLKAEGIE